jgi:hypothetical protein
MDVTPFLDLKIAPRAVFDALAERATRPRWFLPTPDGDWRAVTWGAHARQIRDVAGFLASVGLKSGERACVLAPNRVEWMRCPTGISSSCAAGCAIAAAVLAWLGRRRGGVAGISPLEGGARSRAERRGKAFPLTAGLLLAVRRRLLQRDDVPVTDDRPG